MLAGIRSRLTYANVVSTLCLFVLLGGVAWAAASINSGDVVNDSLKSVDLKNGKGVKGADVVPDSLGGAAVDESSLALGSEAWQAAVLNEGLSGSICFWTAYGAEQTAPAYFRDSSGVVHLKGLVRANDGTQGECTGEFDLAHERITVLPAGYRPNERWVFATLSNNSPGRVNVNPDGQVRIEHNFPSFANAEQWVSLDGITFRCAPSGSDGCP